MNQPVSHSSPLSIVFTGDTSEVLHRILDLRKICRDADFFSVLQIDDKDRRRSGVKIFIREQGSKTRPVGGSATFILSPSFGFADINGFDLLTALLHLDQRTLSKVF